jgi:hypothetical protein
LGSADLLTNERIPFVQGKKVKEIFAAQRQFLCKAAGQKEPNEEQKAVLMTPTVTILTNIGEFRESKRNTPPFNHLSSVSEGLQAVYWVNVVRLFYFLLTRFEYFFCWERNEDGVGYGFMP